MALLLIPIGIALILYAKKLQGISKKNGKLAIVHDKIGVFFFRAVGGLLIIMGLIN